MRGFAHRQRTQQMGMRREEFLDKPVVAILNTWSDMSPCHAHLRDRAEAVKRGVWQAGGYQRPSSAASGRPVAILSSCRPCPSER
jgi:dihydroxy-acid dehydratase